MGRQIDGVRHGPLGDLWRPKYFNGGIAIHGSPSIPPYPASHGCARLSNAAMNWIWATNKIPLKTKVWVYNS
jgi:lipoprotein-anchoring transpeptidase ErfK/SrfK